MCLMLNLWYMSVFISQTFEMHVKTCNKAYILQSPQTFPPLLRGASFRFLSPRKRKGSHHPQAHLLQISISIILTIVLIY
jgi:hypothetical protein